MTHLQRYAEAALPDGYRIAGVQLRPLSIGHILLLTRLGNPWFVRGRKASAADLAVAVAVCSQCWRANLVALHGWRFRARLRWLAIRLMLDSRAGATWRAYLAMSLRAPTVWQKSGTLGQRPLAAPYWLQILMTLQSDIGYSEDVALDLPASQAQWLAIAAWEKGGGTEMASEHEAEVMEHLRN